MARRSLLLLIIVLIAGMIMVTRRMPVGSLLAKMPASRRAAFDSSDRVVNRPSLMSRPTGGSSEPNAAASTRTLVPTALFELVSPTNAPALTAALPAPARTVHYVRLNADWIAGKQSPFWQKPGAGRFDVPLGDGSTISIVIDRSEMLGAERWTSVGHIDGEPQSRAVFACNQGFLHASIDDPQRGRFALRTATADVSQFYHVEPDLVPACAGERRPPIAKILEADPASSAGLTNAVLRAADASAAPAAAAIGPAAAMINNPQHAEIHVMFVYTQAVLPTMTGAPRVAALQSAFDAAVAETNATFAASYITARVKLVGLVETQYDETKSASNKVQDDALTALQSATDGRMDEIHAERDAAGADIVCLALGRADFMSSGLSFLLDTPGSLDNPSYAFSVVQYDTVAGTNVVPHEFGHVLGCAHDRENAFTGRGAYEYSYGFRFFGADGRQYHDIMAYPPGAELAYFSNPNVNVPAPIAAAIGIAPGRPGESDTALTIEQNAFAVSQFRLQTATPANNGTLVHVATRAFVGGGEKVLIGGFVVAGAQPKKMLLRATGPALAAFGVAGALSDPVLRVYAGSSLVAENDNWSIGPGAVDVAQATLQSGAFPLAAGSADAALVVTLPPGAYAAVVDGVGGATGDALLEGYELEHDGGRFIDLATRGYAGTHGRALIGTFTISPGATATSATGPATKRVLIRVLGPSLGVAPFLLHSVLDDPRMELRDAAGNLLIANDDWSSVSRYVVGVMDDFQPLVRSYSEQKIAATGLAPSNRREPCVLVDLPPGSYTVVVQPFEDVVSATPQTAMPGVGLIEVYEIR